jgi:hypothetical protein
MTVLAGVLPRLASLALQPAVLAAGVATGVAVGTVGVGTGAIQVTDPGPRLTALFECPDSGHVVKNLPSDQNVLVTARTADGTWLEIYIGEAGVERGWARASSLKLKAAPDSLPIASCTPSATPEPATAPPTTTPSGSGPVVSSTGLPTGAPATAPPVTPSPIPTASKTAVPTSPPTSAPTAEPTPTATAPTAYLTDAQIHDVPKDVPTNTYIIYPPGCTGYYTLAPFTVRAFDPDGIATVYLYFQAPNDNTTRSVLMDSEGGDLYYGAFGSDGTFGEGIFNYYFTSTDTLGHTRTLFESNQQLVALQYCAD